MTDPFPDKAVRCPATGFAKSCHSIVTKHKCPKYTHIAGTNPNTGEEVNRWGCIDSFLGMLLVENSQMQRQTGAAVETFRNEMVRFNQFGPGVVDPTPRLDFSSPGRPDPKLINGKD